MRLESWLLHWWNKSSACVRYQASASGSRAEDQPLRPTSVAGDVDACAAWPTAPLSPERSARLAAVAEHWLRPLRSRAAADRAAGRPAAAWALAERVGAACPLVMVRSSQIYVHIPGAPPRWAAWAVGDRPSTLRQHVSLRRCGQQGQSLQGDGAAGSDARGGAVDWLDGEATRLVTLLRLLRRALLSDDGAHQPPWPTAFSFRLCLDDLCPSDAADDQQGASASSHGGGNTTTTTTTTAATTTTNASLFRTSVLLDAPLPLLSMVACGGAARASSIPVPQWMATGVAAEHNASAKQWYTTPLPPPPPTSRHLAATASTASTAASASTSAFAAFASASASSSASTGAFAAPTSCLYWRMAQVRQRRRHARRRPLDVARRPAATAAAACGQRRALGLPQAARRVARHRPRRARQRQPRLGRRQGARC